MSVKIKSFLHELLERLNNEQDFEKAQATTLEFIRESSIKDEDRRRMLVAVQYQIHTSKRLYEYLYNAMLKYEGLGTVCKRKDT